MEEVDNIIIDSLKHLQCHFDEDVVSLKQFTPDMAVEAIVTCIKAISPRTNFQTKLPPSMSLKLKLATNIAEHIKELGFRGDMGYQSILYCNEVEIRRVLMFLVERLPRETSSKTVTAEVKGYVPKLIKAIEEKVKQNFQIPWQPKLFLSQKNIYYKDYSLRQDYGDCFMLKTELLQIPQTQAEVSEAVKKYWCHYMPDVTKQCKADNLIPSLLFPSVPYINLNAIKHISSHTHDINDVESSNIGLIVPNEEIKQSTISKSNHEVEDVLKLHDEVKAKKLVFNDLRNEYKSLILQDKKFEGELNKEEIKLRDLKIQIKTKNKTLTVASKEENIEKLKNLIENANERLIALANQWNEVQTPLLEEYRNLQENLNIKESSIQETQDKLQSTKQQYTKLFSELKDKECLEEQLTIEFKQFNKNTTRSAYTKRILEIIGNIKKQNEEIEKILKDTKFVQLENNKLNGQLERSFTLSDEIIFKDAKSDETSRKAYKLLVALHSTCGEVISAITDLGLVERESRNLQEQVEIEESRETGAKLGRVQADLVQVQKEMTALMKQINNN